MSKQKAAEAPINEIKETRYQTSRLIKSRALAGYQPDFAKVILTKSEYTIEEAKAALDAALKKGAN